MIRIFQVCFWSSRLVIDDFNEAVFIERHYIYPGDEERYLHPQNGADPLVIKTRKGKKDVTVFVYSYDWVYIMPFDKHGFVKIINHPAFVFAFQTFSAEGNGSGRVTEL